MTNFMLAALAVALLAGASRAEVAPGEKSGTVMVAVIRQTVEVAARLRGRGLGGRIRNGMTREQVTEILGKPSGALL